MEIVELAEFAVIGLVVEARFDQLPTVITSAWKELHERLEEIADRTSGVLTEVSSDLGDGRYREVLGARVTRDALAPDGMVRIEVPAGRFVRATEAGPLERIGSTFGAMQDHARSIGYRPDGVLVDDGYLVEGAGPHTLLVRLDDTRLTD
jgi:predicted transcriptional regulator YdeE